MTGSPIKRNRKSNFIQIRPFLIFTVGGVREGNTHGEALTRTKGSPKMPRGSRAGVYVVPREKGADHGEFQGHWPGHRAETGGKRSARRGSLLSQPGGSGGDIRKNPQTWVGRIPGPGRRLPAGRGAPDLRANPVGIRVARYIRQQRANGSTDLLRSADGYHAG